VCDAHLLRRTGRLSNGGLVSEELISSTETAPPLKMTFVGRCFGSIADCFYGTGEWAPPNPIPAAQIIPDVILDTSCMGQEAVVVKNGSRLCGTGAARASTPILQNKAYWEVKVQQGGEWSCGVGTPACDLNALLGKDSASWALTSAGKVMSNGMIVGKVETKIQEGDIIGMTYDHVELNFYLNGESLNCPVYGIKGTVFPVFYVDDGAIVDVIFDKFRCTEIPPGFDRIMVEKALL